MREKSPEISHPFWGQIKDSGLHGYTSDIMLYQPFFSEEKIPVYLGEHYIYLTPNDQKLNPGKDYKAIQLILTEDRLTEFAATYVDFIDHMDHHMKTLQQAMFMFYREYLSGHYDQFGVIDTVEKHNEYIKDIYSFRIEAGKQITINFNYHLIWVPAHYAVFVNDKLDNIQGEKIKDNWLPR
ncbi:hypothetical protein SAMN05421821_12325 [Mucilaginibacter lappiensis]|uniref:DUF3298 domain-containing protein n=1 Tax=Mucilaginibacter lappiensis TaxID=354630 RepID=A0ABR6PSY5_9SPHI|nr:hypothetical protein [Mucilaginibacter lappiensis]MBB6112855.1 hypothetical protein [Mucilaginibacter lappiensis]SIS08068.1 hypothetical protein SAMN05421821_12325 [Mucilaginibacter lappiensis]